MSCDERSSAEEDHSCPHRRQKMNAAEQRPLLNSSRHRQSSTSSTGDNDPSLMNYYPEDPEFSIIVRTAEAAIDNEVYPEIISQGSSGSYFVKKMNGVVWLAAETFHYSALERAERKTKEQLINRFPEKLGKRLKGGLPPKVGSFQLFVKGYSSASDMLRKFEESPLPGTVNEQFQKEFEKLVILDYIIRNTDRGHDNWLIKYDIADLGSVDSDKQSSQDVDTAENSNRLKDDKEDDVEGIEEWSVVHHGEVKIAAIDNGLAFPFKHPDEWRAYPYHWAWTPMAKKSFSEDSVNLVLPKLSDEEFVESLVGDIYQLFKTDKNFTTSSFDNQMSVMRGQIANLKRALLERMSPWDLVRLPLVTIDIKQHDPGTVGWRNKRRSFIQSIQKKAPFFSCC
ncbi:phosphatidylinositol 4-kinase type 2-beta-like isoform X2 [Corticium candelabrum]|uniref:phosphatidylinositol 4-kinase type 2-beta-like isoform X2 n=1 Tax=Corticium candelabrum TaxID=121492 RepID=UPI002E27125B|nr:phosphatidylinositol 4-kinase type 2-beta-like isoform X2 [Corticium candelabrum]